MPITTSEVKNILFLIFAEMILDFSEILSFFPLEQKKKYECLIHVILNLDKSSLESKEDPDTDADIASGAVGLFFGLRHHLYFIYASSKGSGICTDLPDPFAAC